MNAVPTKEGFDMATTNFDAIELSGDLTVAGDVIAPLPVQVASANGAITIKHGLVVLTKAGVAAMTLAAPTSGTDDGKMLYIIATTGNAHTVTIANGLSGAGAGADVGTFGGAVADRVVLIAYNGAWYPVVNVNVTFA
jgi:hypothetical protein